MHGTHEDRDALLSRLIDHYRDVGWWIERPEIAGIDLRLRRDAKVLLLACVDPQVPATRAMIETFHRHAVDEAVDGVIVVAPADVEADALTGMRGLDRLRLLDREALQALLGDGIAPALPRSRSRPRKTTGLDLLFRAIAVLCAIGFLLAVLVLLSRTSGTAGEPPPDPAATSKR